MFNPIEGRMPIPGDGSGIKPVEKGSTSEAVDKNGFQIQTMKTTSEQEVNSLMNTKTSIVKYPGTLPNPEEFVIRSIISANS